MTNNIIKTVQDYLTRHGLSDIENLKVIKGRRYWKVVNFGKYNNRQSAEAFYNPETGSIYVAASWAKPAKTRIA